MMLSAFTWNKYQLWLAEWLTRFCISALRSLQCNCYLCLASISTNIVSVCLVGHCSSEIGRIEQKNLQILRISHIRLKIGGKENVTNSFAILY